MHVLEELFIREHGIERITAGVVAESAEGRKGYYLSNVIYGESSAKATSGYQSDAYFEDGTPCLLFVKP